MAKTAKPKKKTPSIRSRTSRRRALSPSLSLNLDKSLQSIPAPDAPSSLLETTGLSSKQQMEKTLHEILLRRKNPLPTTTTTSSSLVSGISKKSSKKKQSARQRRRKETGIEKALGAAERLEKKVEESRLKGKTVRERKGEWGELNGRIEVRREEGVDIVLNKVEEEGRGKAIVSAKGQEHLTMDVDDGNGDDKGDGDGDETDRQNYLLPLSWSLAAKSYTAAIVKEEEEDIL